MNFGFWERRSWTLVAIYQPPELHVGIVREKDFSAVVESLTTAIWGARLDVSEGRPP
jgi:hypothetical protein